MSLDRNDPMRGWTAQKAYLEAIRGRQVVEEAEEVVEEIEEQIVAPEPSPEPEEEPQIEDYTVKELREFAREAGVVGYYAMTKEQLIEALA